LVAGPADRSAIGGIGAPFFLPAGPQFAPQGAIGQLLGQSSLASMIPNCFGISNPIIPFQAGPQFAPQGAIGQQLGDCLVVLARHVWTGWTRPAAGICSWQSASFQAGPQFAPQEPSVSSSVDCLWSRRRHVWTGGLGQQLGSALGNLLPFQAGPQFAPQEPSVSSSVDCLVVSAAACLDRVDSASSWDLLLAICFPSRQAHSLRRREPLVSSSVDCLVVLAAHVWTGWTRPAAGICSWQSASLPGRPTVCAAGAIGQQLGGLLGGLGGGMFGQGGLGQQLDLLLAICFPSRQAHSLRRRSHRSAARWIAWWSWRRHVWTGWTRPAAGICSWQSASLPGRPQFAPQGHWSAARWIAWCLGGGMFGQGGLGQQLGSALGNLLPFQAGHSLRRRGHWSAARWIAWCLAAACLDRVDSASSWGLLLAICFPSRQATVCAAGGHWSAARWIAWWSWRRHVWTGWTRPAAGVCSWQSVSLPGRPTTDAFGGFALNTPFGGVQIGW